MKTKISEQYYYKMLYFNAGKNLMKSNYEYWAGSVSKRRIEKACDTILAMKDNCDMITLKDITGYCRQYVMSGLIETYNTKSNIYTYSDDKCADVCMKAIFICSDNLTVYKHQNINAVTVDLSGCYKTNSGIRGYLPENIAQVAQFFFDKSSTCCLYCENSEY